MHTHSLQSSRRCSRKVTTGLPLFSGGLLCILLSTLAGAALIRRLVLPRITASIQCLQAVAEGKYSARIQSAESADELGLLERDINRLAGQLEDRLKEDVRLKAELEKFFMPISLSKRIEIRVDCGADVPPGQSAPPL